MLKSLFLFSIFLSAFLQAKNELSPCGGWSRLFERQIDGFWEPCNKQTNKCLRKNLFNSTLGSSKTIYNIFDRINEKARIVQRKAHKHTRQSKVFNLFYRFIGRNMRMFPEITSDKRLKSATRVMHVCINYEVAIIWRFKSICISLLKKAPDHWSHVILIVRSFHFRYLRIVFWPSFLLVKLFQRHREVWTWIYSRSTSKVVTAFQVVCQITWHVSGITFHSCKLQSVLSWYVFTAQISYVPSTLHICQNLYRTSAFSFVKQKSITLFD